MMTKSLLSSSVGGPRIDSTCFFDIPSATSSTLALVMRLPTHESKSMSKSMSRRRETRCNIGIQFVIRNSCFVIVHSSVAFAHDKVQTSEHRGNVAYHATRKQFRQDAQINK